MLVHSCVLALVEILPFKFRIVSSIFFRSCDKQEGLVCDACTRVCVTLQTLQLRTNMQVVGEKPHLHNFPHPHRLAYMVSDTV